MGHFGDKFRNAREKKELSLDQVSNVTKISSRMLKAIEEEHFDQLPGGVFNKGFIRAYAKHLGLNDEEAVNDYLTCLREAQVDAREVWEPQALPAAPPAAAKRRPEANKPAPKPPAPEPQAPVQVEELPDLQLPRAEDVRPPRPDFSDQSVSGIPWRLVTVAAAGVLPPRTPSKLPLNAPGTVVDPASICCTVISAGASPPALAALTTSFVVMSAICRAPQGLLFSGVVGGAGGD